MFSDLGDEEQAKPVPPEPHRFVADLDPALVQQVLDVAQRQGISNMHHRGQADDLGAGLEVTKRAGFCHPPRLNDRLAPLKNFALTVALDAIAAVILGGTSLFGGRGTVIGTSVGALLIGTVNNGLIIMGLDVSEQYMVAGTIIILAVAFGNPFVR